MAETSWFWTVPGEEEQFLEGLVRVSLWSVVMTTINVIECTYLKFTFADRPPACAIAGSLPVFFCPRWVVAPFINLAVALGATRWMLILFTFLTWGSSWWAASSFRMNMEKAKKAASGKAKAKKN